MRNCPGLLAPANDACMHRKQIKFPQHQNVCTELRPVIGTFKTNWAHFLIERVELPVTANEIYRAPPFDSVN
eukprot:scaffold18345_cov76-Skeletonema_dohrnii-CCMP3373.AAC.4